MLKINIIVVDRTRSDFLREGESFYLKRLRNYLAVSWQEVKATKMLKGKSEKEILDVEGDRICRSIPAKSYLVALDRKGKTLDSEGLARWVEHPSRHAAGGLCFVIGGPLGLSQKVLELAQEVLSLSRFTLTHEMSRLLLLEQLYRAMTILKGEKYHK